MIRVTVAYPNGKGASFDHAYYKNTHLPLVRKLLGAAVKGAEINKPILTPGADSPAWLGVGSLLFESTDAFQAAFGAHAEAILGDLPNFTNIQPTVVVSEVVPA
jgi:uncharacterized protein (TIGR02118 family)